MALTRVQSTGVVTAALIGGTSITLTFPAPPTIGNAIVVLVSVYRGAGGLAVPFPGCSDNHGHTYLQAEGIVEAIGQGTAAVVYHCPALTATGTFTVTFDVGVTLAHLTACALEVSGGVPALVLHETSRHQGGSTTPTTGATAGLTTGAGLVVAVSSLVTSVASLAVSSATPPWTEEYESLTTATAACGEADSRLITGALGTTESATWTAAAASNYAAVLAVFAPTAAGPLLAAFGNRTAGLDQAFTIDQRDDGTTDLYAPGRLAIGTDDRVAITAPDDLYVNAEGVVTGLSGDVTAAGPGVVPATIAADAVTYAKMQNVTAASRVLGRGSAAGAGDPEELTLGSGLTMTGTVLSASGGSASPHYDCPLSDGDLTAADLIYAAGECIIVQVPV